VPSDGADLLGRAVYAQPHSPECLAVAKNWLHECLNTHEKCRLLPASHGSLPTRVIDVGHDSRHPKLIHTHNNAGTYVALSYCWGGDSTFVLNAKTSHDLETGLPLSDYPRTLRDAIIITRSLEIDFLWVDALCIKQDSKEDVSWMLLFPAIFSFSMKR
jgi:hypothetical protein